MVELSHPYMTTGKTIALTIQFFIGKVISLLFSMMSRFQETVYFVEIKGLLMAFRLWSDLTMYVI